MQRTKAGELTLEAAVKGVAELLRAVCTI